jgi:hypothetical protein
MEKIETFEQFLVSADATSFSYVDFSINMALAIVIALMIRYTYIKCGTSVSNRKNLAQNFPLLVITTVFVITIVKSSLALSLGLVGALSIVRFRTAVKEPVELMYLFFCIAVGLGLGADQRVVSITASIMVLGYIWVKYFMGDSSNPFNEKMILSIESSNGEIELTNLVKILEDSTEFVSLVRLEHVGDKIEAYFNVEFKDINNMDEFKKHAYSLDKNARITILDNNGLI